MTTLLVIAIACVLGAWWFNPHNGDWGKWKK